MLARRQKVDKTQLLFGCRSLFPTELQTPSNMKLKRCYWQNRQ